MSWFKKSRKIYVLLDNQSMVSLMKYIKGCRLTQVEAAKRFSVTQSRMSNLMSHRIDLFSTEMLLDMMERVGFRIYEKMEVDIDDFLMHAWPQSKSSKQAHTKHYSDQ